MVYGNIRVNMKSNMTRKSRAVIAGGDAFLLSRLQNKLEEESIKVATYHDGADILTSIFVSKPHLVVLDFILPSLSGIEVLAQMRTHPETKDIPVLLFSQQLRKEEKKQVEAFYPCEYIVTSEYTFEEIVSKVLKHVERVA